LSFETETYEDIGAVSALCQAKKMNGIQYMNDDAFAFQKMESEYNLVENQLDPGSG
jgi:hypothetical protein